MSLYSKAIISFLLILLNFNFVRSQQKELSNLNFVEVEAGISKRPIYDIQEDQYGFIWIATRGAGIFKYDGIEYKNYTYDLNNEFSINSNIIYSLFLDSNNTLWVGTNIGLNRYNKDLDKFERINLENASDGKIDIITLTEDNKGNLLLGTYSQGVVKVNLQNLRVSKVEFNGFNEEETAINTLVKNKEGIIYAGTDKGLKVLNQKENTLSTAFFTVNNSRYSYDNNIESLLFDNADLLIGSLANGITKIIKKKNDYKVENYPVTKKKVFSMLPINKNILVATENDGLIVLDKKGEIVHKYKNNANDYKGVPSNSIWSLCLDKDGRIWIGTYNRGVAVYDKLFSKFETIKKVEGDPNNLQATSITAIEKDRNGNLWIGLAGGVDIYNPITKKIEHINNSKNSKYQGFIGEETQAVFIDSQNNVWVGTWNKGIFLLKKGVTSFVNYSIENTDLTSNGVVGFSEDSKGRIWIASFLGGVHYYDPVLKKIIKCKSKSFVTHKATNLDVKVVYVDIKDTIWIGTTNGLFKVIESKEDELNFVITPMQDKMPEQLKNHPNINDILSIYESIDGQIWVGTDGAGLLKYNKKNETFTKLENFNETSINAITEDQYGNLWVSGKLGLTNIKFDSHKIRNYTVSDGLIEGYFNNGSVCRDQKGTLYFGGFLGINYFNPEDIELNKSEPTLYFSNLKLFNKDVPIGSNNSPLQKAFSETKKITLNHNQSVFTIEYGSISYTRPEKNQYAYFLEGFDKQWNYVENVRNATYTNLPQGEYVFKVKSANNDGVWNKKPLELKLEIRPPWWKTKVAYLIYVLSFILIFYGVVLFLRTRFREKEAVKFEREKRLQEEQLNKKKIQFFTNISHEFRTPLTLIVNPLTDIVKKYDDLLPNDVKEKNKTILKNVDRLSRLINELMDFRKLESNKILVQAEEVEIVRKVKNIISYFKEEANYRTITLSFATNAEEIKSWIDPKMLEKILFNILSNAFKVTPNKGAIDIFLNTTPSNYTISVKDTGPGMDQKEYKKIFKRFYQIGKINKSYYGSTGIGLEMVKSFTELNKGEISVESELNKGTTFTVKFPRGKKHFSENEILKEENTFIDKASDFEIDKNELQFVDENHISLNFDNKEFTVLIVEDNQELRTYLESELKATYKVITAENGKIGVEMAEIKTPDIIVTDVVMPLLDGFELCKRVKENMKTSHIPLVMLTSKAMVEDKLVGINYGADGYLSKPFNMEILKSTINQLLISRQILFNKYSNESGVDLNIKSHTTSLDKTFIQQVLEYVNEHIDEQDLNVELLASHFSLSRSQFYRKLKALSGVSANVFIRKVRLETAKNLLESSDLNVNEVIYKVGFSSASYFAKCFKVEYGYLPAQIKRK